MRSFISKNYVQQALNSELIINRIRQRMHEEITNRKLPVTFEGWSGDVCLTIHDNSPLVIEEINSIFDQISKEFGIENLSKLS